MLKQAKKCKVCGKILRIQNKSGLCSHHYRIVLMKKLRQKRKENRLCVQCGKKVEPIILYPAGKTIPPIIKRPIRCYDCRKKEGKYYQIWRKKQKNKELLSLKSD